MLKNEPLSFPTVFSQNEFDSHCILSPMNILNNFARYFLQYGYAVIFLHRQRSLEPFCRHFEGHNALDLLEIQVGQNGSYSLSGKI